MSERADEEAFLQDLRDGGDECIFFALDGWLDERWALIPKGFGLVR